MITSATYPSGTARLRFRRALDGKLYLFERNDFGWGCVSLESPTDRFHRSYQIQALPDGTPTRCSCPDCHHRGNWCKHLREIDLIRRELDPALVEQDRKEARRAGPGNLEV